MCEDKKNHNCQCEERKHTSEEKCCNDNQHKHNDCECKKRGKFN